MAPSPDNAPPLAVSLVIPVYNEHRAIAETLTQCRDTLEKWGGEFEIILVDDGSTDGSVQAARDSKVEAQILQHEENQGYGAALKTGFAAARHDHLAFLDADGSYPIDELPRLLEAASKADMVVAQRQDYAEHSSLARRLGKAILLPLANYLSGRKIPDLNSGMRVVRRNLVERYWPLLPDGFSLTTTITMALLCARRRVLYLPVAFSKRSGKSKIRPLRDMTNFLLLLLRTATYFKPLKVYLPLSSLLVASSVGVVLASKYLSAAHEVMDVTALFLFIAGLQTLLIGVVADLILKLIVTRR